MTLGTSEPGFRTRTGQGRTGSYHSSNEARGGKAARPISDHTNIVVLPFTGHGFGLGAYVRWWAGLGRARMEQRAKYPSKTGQVKTTLLHKYCPCCSGAPSKSAMQDSPARGQVILAKINPQRSIQGWLMGRSRLARGGLYIVYLRGCVRST